MHVQCRVHYKTHTLSDLNFLLFCGLGKKNASLSASLVSCLVLFLAVVGAPSGKLDGAQPLIAIIQCNAFQIANNILVFVFNDSLDRL